MEVYFSVGSPDDYSSVGHFTGLSLPLPPSFIFTATRGSDFDNYPEGDLSGIARRQVAALVVTMANGESLTVQPASAPRHLRERLPWLRGLQFYYAFFPDDQKPQQVAALDRDGEILARSKYERGAFR